MAIRFLKQLALKGLGERACPLFRFFDVGFILAGASEDSHPSSEDVNGYGLERAIFLSEGVDIPRDRFVTGHQR